MAVEWCYGLCWICTYSAVHSGPLFIEMLKQQFVLKNFLLSKNEQDNSHECYISNGVLAGCLNLVSMILLCLAIFLCFTSSMSFISSLSRIKDCLQIIIIILIGFIALYTRVSKCFQHYSAVPKKRSIPFTNCLYSVVFWLVTYSGKHYCLCLAIFVLLKAALWNWVLCLLTTHHVE